MGSTNEMEPDEDKKKLNEDFIAIIRKQSKTQAPRYIARLKSYVDLQRKRERATAARRNYDKSVNESRKKGDDEAKDKALDKSENQGGDKERLSRRSFSRSRSGEPSDGCGRRRRRRRRKSCGRKRRRRRSCRRRRRRRRSCGRRRRSSRRRRSRARRRQSCCQRRRRRRRRRAC